MHCSWDSAPVTRHWRPRFGQDADNGVPRTGPGRPPALRKRHGLLLVTLLRLQAQTGLRPLSLGWAREHFQCGLSSTCARPSEPPVGPASQNTRQSHGPRRHWLHVRGDSTLNHESRTSPEPPAPLSECLRLAVSSSRSVVTDLSPALGPRDPGSRCCSLSSSLAPGRGAGSHLGAQI